MAFAEAKGTKLNVRPFKPPTMSSAEPKSDLSTKFSNREGPAKAPVASMRGLKQVNMTDVSRVAGPTICLYANPVFCTNPEHPCPQYLSQFKDFLAQIDKVCSSKKDGTTDRRSREDEDSTTDRRSCEDEQHNIEDHEDHPIDGVQQDSSSSTSDVYEPENPEEKIPNDTDFEDSGVAFSKPTDSPSIPIDDGPVTSDIPSPKKTESQINAEASENLVRFASSVEDSQTRGQSRPDNAPELDSLTSALGGVIEYDKLQGDAEREDLQRQEEQHDTNGDTDQQQRDLVHTPGEKQPNALESAEDVNQQQQNFAHATSEEQLDELEPTEELEDEDAKHQQQDLVQTTTEEQSHMPESIDEAKDVVAKTVNPKRLQRINHEADDDSFLLPGFDQTTATITGKRKRPLAGEDDSGSDVIRVASQISNPGGSNSEGAEEPNSSADTVTTEELPATRTRRLQTYGRTRSTAPKTAASKQASKNFTKVTKVFFASSTSGNGVMKKVKAQDLKNLGIEKARKVEQCDAFCTNKDSHIAKSPNLLHALALGKPIITDDWLTDSIQVKFKKTLSNYWAKDLTKEKEWGCKIRETSTRFKNGLKLFEDKSIVVTPSLKSELDSSLFDGLRNVTLAAGAERFESRYPRTEKNREDDAEKTVWLAKEKDPLLKDLGKQQVFSKDLIAMSVLRAQLDLESDEFRLKTGAEAEPAAKKRRTTRRGE